MPCDLPIDIWRRTNDPAVAWGFDSAPGVPFDLAGSTFDLLVEWPGGSIEHTSDPGAGDGVLTVDLATGDVSWPYTRRESETIPKTGARYELFRTIDGKRRIWCGGAITMQAFLR